MVLWEAYHLQTGGRPMFRIRHILAATANSLYGMYSGYELCEAEPVPGKEEYLNSEKYEFKVRDWSAPGHITNEVARINEMEVGWLCRCWWCSSTC